jgi:hypothetical protein
MAKAPRMDRKAALGRFKALYEECRHDLCEEVFGE